MRQFLFVLMLLVPNAGYAQDWVSVQSLPKETRVRIREPDRAGGLVEGRFLVAEVDRITILRGGRSLVIPKTSIDRIQQVRNDSIWNGAIIGAIAGWLVQSTYGAEGCLSRPQPQCTLAVMGVWGGMGALFDYGIPSVKTVYRASRPAMTLLRVTF